MIPLVDLAAQHAEVAEAVEAGFRQVIHDTSFVDGPPVRAFEKEFADFTGRRCCIGVGNGTDALELILRAAGIAPGDQVIVPAATFVATAEAPARLGAEVVVVDVDPEDLLLDPDQVARHLSPRTRAVIAVHLYGRLAPMSALAEVIADRDVVLVEDAAQAQGAVREGLGIGSWSVAAATSFYPGKNLGAYGDAGAVVTDDDELAHRVRLLANHGSPRRYHHEVAGGNSRLDTLQAVVLSAKLRHLDRWNAARRAGAARYHTMLRGHPEITLAPLGDDDHVWHLYPVRVPRRDAVLSELHRQGIGAGIHYPVPVHGCAPFATSAPTPCPHAERAADELLSLPLHPHLDERDQQRVVEALLAALHRTRHPSQRSVERGTS
jgi:dTDP-4-amino-4,6-dideoxygalactose transaminase